MGKFCVKAAIVSSLAVAEEDYNTAIGAPIEVKRNLIARSLKKGQQPGQTPQIISEGGSLRALNKEAGWCCSSINPSKPSQGENNSNMKQLNQLKDLEEQNSKELKELKKELKNVNMVSGNSIKDSAKEIFEDPLGAIDTGLNLLSEGFTVAQKEAEDAKKKIVGKVNDLKKYVDILKDAPKDELSAKVAEIQPQIQATTAILTSISILTAGDTTVKSLIDRVNGLQKMATDFLEKAETSLDANALDPFKKELNNVIESIESYSNQGFKLIDNVQEKLGQVQSIGSLLSNLLGNKSSS